MWRTFETAGASYCQMSFQWTASSTEILILPYTLLQQKNTLPSAPDNGRELSNGQVFWQQKLAFVHRWQKLLSLVSFYDHLVTYHTTLGGQNTQDFVTCRFKVLRNMLIHFLASWCVSVSCVVVILVCFCQYQCKLPTGKTHPQNDLQHVNSKLNSI